MPTLGHRGHNQSPTLQCKSLINDTVIKLVCAIFNVKTAPQIDHKSYCRFHYIYNAFYLLFAVSTRPELIQPSEPCCHRSSLRIYIYLLTWFEKCSIPHCNDVVDRPTVSIQTKHGGFHYRTQPFY